MTAPRGDSPRETGDPEVASIASTLAMIATVGAIALIVASLRHSAGRTAANGGSSVADVPNLAGHFLVFALLAMSFRRTGSILAMTIGFAAFPFAAFIALMGYDEPFLVGIAIAHLAMGITGVVAMRASWRGPRSPASRSQKALGVAMTGALIMTTYVPLRLADSAAHANLSRPFVSQRERSSEKHRTAWSLDPRAELDLLASCMELARGTGSTAAYPASLAAFARWSRGLSDTSSPCYLTTFFVMPDSMSAMIAASPVVAPHHLIRYGPPSATETGRPAGRYTLSITAFWNADDPPNAADSLAVRNWARDSTGVIRPLPPSMGMP